MKLAIKDELLLDRWRRHPPDALAEILAEYGRPFYGFLIAACGGVEETARGFFTRVFLQTLHSPALESRKIPFFPELFRYAVKELRCLAKEISVPSEIHVLGRLSRDKDIKTRLLLCLKILTRIPVDDRIMILLRDLAELEISEMAYVMDMKEDRLKSRLNEARIHFREKMNEFLRTKEFYDLRRG